ncbi:MAG: UDP-4-amino-4,6-dideoxy-N-acetyl-beta-L-altrosamine transaminase [Candidatus Pelagibacter sp.]|nr:UDP-4-amino-4,6-dideoxy-N-acetyl-beta-L-altrosamine transaminase [Candidatus Pelagibacter sp.]
MIPYARQHISNQDINFVKKILKSEYLTSGPTVIKFEKKVAEYCNAKFAVATNSATSALHIACLCLGLKKDDYVWTSPVSFVASSNCVLYCGAKIDFIDIDPSTFNICIQALKKKLIIAKKKNKLPKILIPVHLGGLSCDMLEIRNLAKKFKFKIIEDASHAIGGRYRDKPIGSCKYSDITVFSFHPVKIITSAEGGMALTNYKKLTNKMKILRNSGITRDKKIMKNYNNNPWYYEQHKLGYNYRLSDVHSALGLSQLSKIDIFTKRRNYLSNIYDKELKKLNIKFQKNLNNSYSSRHLYICRVPESKRKKIISYLLKKKIMTNLHYIPIYKHPFYRYLGFKNYKLKNTEKYYKEALTLPLYYSLSIKEQKRVIKTLREALKLK